MLYAGQPQNDRNIVQGPFVGDSREDIARLYQEYRDGRFQRLSELTKGANAVRRGSDDRTASPSI